MVVYGIHKTNNAQLTGVRSSRRIVVCAAQNGCGRENKRRQARQQQHTLHGRNDVNQKWLQSAKIFAVKIPLRLRPVDRRAMESCTSMRTVVLGTVLVTVAILAYTLPNTRYAVSLAVCSISHGCAGAEARLMP